MKIILFKSLIIIVLLISISLLPIFYPSGAAIYVRLFLLILIFIESFKLFKNIFIDKKVNNIISNLGVILFSLFITFIFLEAIFMFVPRSNNFDFTLSSKLWFSKYWTPINSLGFRDNEPSNNHPVILFVGNSFTAGHGLKSVDDRFSNIVGNELNKRGGKYNIINIGENGLHTRTEYETMINFYYMTKIKPEKIILQYSGNDIYEAAVENGLKYEVRLPMNKYLIAIGSGSYLFNYLYWSFSRDCLTEPYTKFLVQAYKNNDIMSKHKDDLGLFVKYAQKNSMQLIVVVFPYLYNIGMSDSLYGESIVNYFKAYNVSTINVSPLVKDIPVSERIININDAHASKKVNKMVADEILKTIYNN